METVARSRDGSIHVTDERINTASHLAGACFALMGSGLLVTQAGTQGDPWKLVGLAVYALSVINLFVSSTLHHGLNGTPRLNEILRTLDYDSSGVQQSGVRVPVSVSLRNG